MEIEGGFQVNSFSYLTANLYDISTSDVIVYTYDENFGDKYLNFGRTGTRGVEVDYKLKMNTGFVDMNYSYYTTAGKPVNIEYYAGKGKNLNLAFPAHKAGINANIPVCRHFTFNPSIKFVSERWYYQYEELTQTESYLKFAPAWYANAALNFRNIFSDGFDIQVACMNILDQSKFYIQPYNSNHAPLPGSSRELQIKLSYNFKTDK
jgi:hypothetical protein